jgi:hypothetical protein
MAEGVGARKAVDLLAGVRSVVDVRIYIRRPGADEWRPLTLGEQKLVWEFREKSS